MTVYERLQAILQCPLTGSTLRLLEPEELRNINNLLGSLTHVNGLSARSPLEAGFITTDSVLLYPVLSGILHLLPSSAIVLQPEQIDTARIKLPVLAAKASVQEFYDQVGWTEVTDELFTDAAQFEDLRPIAEDYIHRCHLKVRRYVESGGDFLLDIASGPVQHSDYLTYSENYSYRICADISVVALQAARRKLGDRGIYLLCDITKLPLSDASMDGFVSLHTIYHVPAEEQAIAFFELHRVLKPNHAGVVVYSWGHYSGVMAIVDLPLIVISRIKWLLSLPMKVAQRLGPVFNPIQAAKNHVPQGGAPLYFHTHSYSWFIKVLQPHMQFEILSWRSVSVPSMQSYAHGALGKWLLATIYAWEERFPRFFGKFGFYPLIVIRK